MFKFEVVVLTEEEFHKLTNKELHMTPCILVGQIPNVWIEKDRYGYLDSINEIGRCNRD